jgi:glucosylglycerate synthase
MSVSGDTLPDSVAPELRAIGQRDIVVGIPTFNSEATVGGVVTAVEAGIRKAFPDRAAAIVISDGGSSDRTVQVALESGVGEDAPRYLVDPDSPEPAKVALAYPGLPGKGSAFRAILEVAGRLGAGGCAAVDSDLRSIQPFWLEHLLGPVLDHGFDYVAPVYVRHRFDGTITNSIAFPLTTTLYGARIRQPIGGEFGFSGRLAAHWAERNVWHTDVARFGIDIWMTTIAVVEGFRVCQANLGAKIHDPKDPGADLGPMFRQVVGSLFALAGKYHSTWSEVSTISEPPTFGMSAAYSAEPVAVSRQRLLWKFVEGHTRHGQLWREVMAEETFDGVMRAIREAGEHPRGLLLPPSLWFRLVYDFLVAYNDRQTDAGGLLDSFVPLYFARTASFVDEAAEDTDEEAEARINQLVDVAMELKPYLVERWRERGVPERRLADQPVPREGRPGDWVH